MKDVDVWEKYSKKYISEVEKSNMCSQNDKLGTSLVAQWIGLRTPNAGGPGSIPRLGTRFHMHAATKSSRAPTKEPTCHN